MTFEDELTALSLKCKSYIRSGQISMYSKTLKELAELFHRNNRTWDQLKVLVISFYIDLSGFSRASFIDYKLVAQIQAIMQLNDVPELEHSFFEWIQPDMIPQHALSVKDCWYLLRLCVDGKVEQADYILTKI